MGLRKEKACFFVLEGLNAFATTYYFYYLFFFMRTEYGFGNVQNLSLSAINGLVYMVSAWFGGRYGQRHGYHRALLIGFSVMGLSLLAGLGMPGGWKGQLLVMLVWTVGMCFTWPTLEAAVSHREPPARLQRMVGIYNLVWAGVSALAYFLGGGLLELLGKRSLFWLPAGLHLVQILLLLWMRRDPAIQSATATAHAPTCAPHSATASGPIQANPRPIARTRTFLKLAWLANPFAYVAINTVVPVIPEIAHQLHLSPARSGIFCSIWFFSRLATFFVLWLWRGWHYRFFWFIASFVLLLASFAILLLANRLWILCAAQVVFGAAVGLIYYSSLFYSMDSGENQGEHGGLHEAAIGAGIFVGPALGACTLHFFPQHTDSSTWAVSALLLVGLVASLWIMLNHRKNLRLR